MPRQADVVWEFANAVDGEPKHLDRITPSIGGIAIGLALLVGIVVGNGVEAYGAAQPIIAGGHPRRFAVALVGGIGLALASATVLGATVLTGGTSRIDEAMKLRGLRPGASSSRITCAKAGWQGRSCA